MLILGLCLLICIYHSAKYSMDQFYIGLWSLFHVVEYARHIITKRVNEGTTRKKGEPDMNWSQAYCFIPLFWLRYKMFPVRPWLKACWSVCRIIKR